MEYYKDVIKGWLKNEKKKSRWKGFSFSPALLCCFRRKKQFLYQPTKTMDKSEDSDIFCRPEDSFYKNEDYLWKSAIDNAGRMSIQIIL